MWPSEEIITVGGRRYLFVVETSDQLEDYSKYEDLRNTIWGDPGDFLACPRTMAAENVLHEGGSLFLGVFIESDRGKFPRDAAHMVGFAYGFVGLIDKQIGYRDPSNLAFYSQFAGVAPAFQNLGLGIHLKRFQARAVLNGLGVSRITCTYDPLVGVNAHRNVRRLEMEVRAYKAACYQWYTGHLNRLDVPTDRFLVMWDLVHARRSTAVDAAALLERDRLAVSSREMEVEGRSGRQRLSIAEERDLPEGDEPLLVEIPFDFYTLLQETAVEDPEVRRIPVDWRMATRRAFQTLLDAGWRVVDFRCFENAGRKRDFYVLSP